MTTIRVFFDLGWLVIDSDDTEVDGVPFGALPMLAPFGRGVGATAIDGDYAGFREISRACHLAAMGAAIRRVEREREACA